MSDKSENQARHFKIIGMDCAEEVAVLKQELAPLVGGEDRLAFDILRAKLTLSSAASDVTEKQILDSVSKAGMRAELWNEKDDAHKSTTLWSQWGRTILTAVSGCGIICGCLVWLLVARFQGGATGTSLFSWVANSLYGLAIISGAWFVVPKAILAARRLRPDMNLLMVIAISGAVIIGEWLEAATVSFLFSLSLLLEHWSVGRARRAIAALTELAPTEVRIVTGALNESLVSPEDVAIDSIFIVKPGERIPLDGEVQGGNSHVNQAPITGESEPVPKQVGDEVFAGTINGDGALRVRSTRQANDTTLARVIQLVSEASANKAPSEKWIEKFARVYTPTVIVLALIVLVFPPLLFGGSWHSWFYNSLVLLVIACPCALVISTPVTIVCGLTSAARQGVLVKGGTYLESPAHLTAIAFDKTGTLTHGKPVVHEIIPLGKHSESELIERAVALESHSEHPLARAIVTLATQSGAAVPPAEKLQVIKGKGVTGIVHGKPFWIGSPNYMKERGQGSKDIEQAIDRLFSSGRTVVVIGNDQHVCGLIGVSDAVRSSARRTIDELRNAGVQHLVMLTGDNKMAAQSIAEQVGLTDFRFELHPEDKIAAVESLVKQFGQVAMLGDGVNDAPALARASLGIAMGAIGTDAAIETADVALMTDDLSRIPWLIHHSRRTLRIIRQNVVFSLAIKAIFLALSVAGMATLWMAIAADTGASLLVVFNGLRMLYPKEESRD